MEVLRRWWRVGYPIYGIGLLAGLVMMWLPFKTYQDNEAWAERLRVDGTHVQGVVYKFVHKGRNSDTMHLRYEWAGAERRAEVPCGSVCHTKAGTAVGIWVNPDDPGDFVTDFGTLSGHRGQPQAGIGFAGLVLSGWGVLAAITRLDARRRARRRRARGR